MYGPPGRVYVYFTYGVHWCVNLVCEPEGRASAVLLRAGEVVGGEDLARARRGVKVPAARIASGPANLAAALGVDGTWYGTDATSSTSPLTVRPGPPVRDADVVAGPRVGISRAVEAPWRFLVAGNPCVSRPRRAGG
jgi:DNA-3-methyladenine glycosylase